MNELVIPHSPNWYLQSVFQCAPDNTIVFGAFRDLFVFNPTESDKAVDVKVIYGAHNDRVTAISLNNSSWNAPEKLAVSIGDDKIVRLWDLNKYAMKDSHKGHVKNKDDVASVSFIGDRIVSVSESGVIIIWRLSSNELSVLPDIFNQRVKIVCMSSCPHASWLTAFGLHSGLIIVADLRKNGRVLYKLRSHNNEITSLAWCPSPYNIYKASQNLKTEIVPTVKFTISDADKSETVTSQQKDDDVNETEKTEIPEKTETEEEEIEKLDTCSEKEEDESTNSSPKVDVKTEIENTEEEGKEEVTSTTSELGFPCVDYRTIIPDSGDKKEYLLASVCKGGLIYIWRAGSDGRMQIMLPKVYQNVANKRNKYNDKLNNWIALCWVTPHMLLTCSHNQLLRWNLLPTINLTAKKNSKEPIFKPSLVHTTHLHQIFQIATPLRLYPLKEQIEVNEDSESNEVDDDDIKIWTTSRDRYILCTNLSGKENNVVAFHSCMGSFVKCFATSPIDPHKIAIGCCDACCYIWNLSSSRPQFNVLHRFWDKIKSQITCLDWHPVKEHTVAFGTGEGRIGEICETDMRNALYSAYHRTPIHKLQFGPHSSSNDCYGLYSCSNGQLTVHEDGKHSIEPKVISLGGNIYVTYFDWKMDYSVLAIGTKDGHVKLLTKDFVPYETLYMQKKSVQCIVWHPLSTVADSAVSPYVNYLAVSTNEMTIFVYQCANYDDKMVKEDSKLVATLEGHVSSVSGLAWCPHIGGRLASCSEDGTAMVWDVVSSTLLSTFNGHCKTPIVAIMWSPLDADLIITSGKDNTVRVWRITKNPPKLIEKQKKKSGKGTKSDAVIELDKETLCPIETSTNSVVKCHLLPTVSKLLNTDTLMIPLCRKLLEMTDYDDDKMDSDHDSSKEEEEDEENVEEPEQTIDPIQLFGSRKDITSLLNYEQNLHKSKKKWNAGLYIAMWKGNLEEYVNEALNSGVVTPEMINLAPMICHKLWSDLCLAYAEKLAESDNGLEAAVYYLACHKIMKAIDVLCAAGLYREALTLARYRLLPTDPTHAAILEKWCYYAIRVGSFEIAAQCLIKLKRFSEAGEILNKRSDPDTLQLAAELATRGDNKDLYNAIQTKLDELKKKKQKQNEKGEEKGENVGVDVEQVEIDDDKFPTINICESRFEAMLRHDKKSDDDHDHFDNDDDSQCDE